MTAYPECANELLLLKRQAELGGIKRALEDFTQRVNLPEASQLAGLLLRNTSLGTELVGSLALAGRPPAFGPAASGLDRGQQDAGQADLSHHVLFRPGGAHSVDRAGHHAVGGLSPQQPDFRYAQEQCDFPSEVDAAASGPAVTDPPTREPVMAGVNPRIASQGRRPTCVADSTVSEISTRFLFFRDAVAQTIHLKANGRPEKIRSDPNSPVRPRGTCIPRKRP